MEERRNLIRKIYEQDEKCEKIKAWYMRGIILLYFVLNFVVLYIAFLYNKTFDLGAVGMLALIAAILAAVSYWVNFSIFHASFHKIEEENRKLKALEKRLGEFDKEHNIDTRNSVENRIIYGHM